MDEFADPEMSFRRGYEHGAYELFDKIGYLLPAAIAAQVKDWLDDVREWRFKNLRGEQTRLPEQSITFDLGPPTLKLKP